MINSPDSGSSTGGDSGPFEMAGSRTPLLGLLYVLFLRPSLVFAILERETLWRTAIRVIGLAVCCGLILTAFRTPALYRGFHDWVNWLQKEMGQIELSSGELAWHPRQPLPYSKHFKGWRVSFIGDAKADFDPDKRLGPESSGLWVSPTRIYYWQRTGRDRVVGRQVADASTLFKVFASGQRGDGADSAVKLSLNGPGRMFAAITVLVLVGAATVVGVVGEVLFYSALFSLLPILLRSPQARMGMKKSLVLYLNVSLVPLFVAMVYSLLRVPFLDFNTVYAFVFVGYLAFVIISARAKLREMQEGGRG